MKKILLLSCCALALGATAQLNPLLQRQSSTADDKIYDTKAWSFATGAAIRSTPLVTEATVFFGNAAGVFYALDKKSGLIRWKYATGQAIQSSATLANGNIFFADNQQAVYALNERTGKLVWKHSCGKKLAYPWRFDYFYSSPVIFGDKIVIGSDDGFVYMLSQRDGKPTWKFKANSLVRTTVAIDANTLYFGDTDGKIYGIDARTGQNKWNFSTLGDTLRSEDFGYDRKAILSSPVVYHDKIIFGSRDGYLYCINKDGSLRWTSNHEISWVISTVAIKDNIVVTGTSDGRFVQAVDVNTGKELWRFKAATLFWSSPLIVNDKIYIGAFDGQLYCLDLKTGQRISQFATGGTILSSPIYNEGLVYIGSDDGNLYALEGHSDMRVQGISTRRRYVFYEPGVNIYYKDGSDLRVKNYLAGMGFKTVGSDSLTALLKTNIGANSVLVFASDYFPPSVSIGGEQSLLRQYLDRGGRVILTGLNPLVYRISEKEKTAYAFNVPAADTVLGLKYDANDTRSFGGILSSFPTEKGSLFGITDPWVSMLFIDPSKVDIVFGKNENGLASAFLKRYKNAGELIQIFLDADMPVNMDAVVKLGEWELK